MIVRSSSEYSDPSWPRRLRTSVRLMSATLDLVDDRQPLSREEFRQLKRDDLVCDRGGRVRTLRADAYFDRAEGEHRTILVAGAQVLIERERFHDSYVLLPPALTPRGGRPSARPP